MKPDITLEYEFNVYDGKMVVSERSRLLKEVKLFEGMRGLMTLTRWKKKRSSEQNRYFHGVMVPLVQVMLQENGFSCISPAMAKQDIKNLFLTWEETIGDVTMTHTKDTSDLDTQEFSALIENVQRWAVEKFGFQIPNPGEQLTIDETDKSH